MKNNLNTTNTIYRQSAPTTVTQYQMTFSFLRLYPSNKHYFICDSRVY